MRPVRGRPRDEELLVEGHTAFRLGIELHHPALDAVGIELRVDGAYRKNVVPATLALIKVIVPIRAVRSSFVDGTARRQGMGSEVGSLRNSR